MENYIEASLSIAQGLHDMNAGLDDEFAGVLLLDGLPEEYDPTVIMP